VVLEKKNDGAGAEKAFREALLRDGHFGPAHNNLGAILLGRNDLTGSGEGAAGCDFDRP
jgi:hypothetical protein